MRIINVPHRGLGEKAIEKIKEYSILKNVSFYEALTFSDQISDLSNSARKNIRDLINMFEDIKNELFNNSPHQLLEKILIKSGYWQMTEEISEKDINESMNRLGNLQELVNAIKEFEDISIKRGITPTLSNYLEEVMLQSEVDSLNDKSQAITLMTIHLAKGLEFPVVFLTGLEEGLFPINAAFSNDDEMEEERRLMYVGMTRAKKKLYISWANSRKIFGKTYPNLMSRFIIEANLTKWTKNDLKEREIQENYYDNKPRLSAGRKVSHPVYGIGRVEQITGSGEFTKVTVVFDSGIRQTFMLKYAALEII